MTQDGAPHDADRKDHPRQRSGAFRRGNIRWCGWCGETLSPGNSSFCCLQCLEDYRADIGMSV
jgi:hypothetical protein